MEVYDPELLRCPDTLSSASKRSGAEHLLDRLAHDDWQHRAQFLRDAGKCRIDSHRAEPQIVRECRLQLLVQALAQTQIQRDLQLPARLGQHPGHDRTC